METPTLRATKRDILGKKTRFLRRQGVTPTHLFGHNIESLPLQCNTAQLKWLIARVGTTRPVSLEIEADKQPRNVFIREIQKDACTGLLLHVDFYQIKKTEKITVDVPIILVGEAPAMKVKGRTLLQPITRLGVKCLPDNLPPQIEIDLSHLEEVEQAIHVKDIVLSPDITVTTNAEQMVVKIAEAAVPKLEEVVAEVEEEAVEAAAEGADEQSG